MADIEWEDVEALYEAARARPAGERDAFLEEACDDPAVRREVASLLEAREEATGFFGDLADAVGGSSLHPSERGVRRGSPVADPLDIEGAQVGRYAVETHLGSGGMGVVYRARDPQLDRPVVLKFLPPHLSRSLEAQQRFAREAKAASVLEHSNIATIYEIGQAEDGAAEGQRFIAMAYYEGETLREKLRREGALPVEEALRYAEQVAEALARAHEAGIVHRDVKPANVMVTEAGEVKLLDFGLARAAAETRLTEPGQQMGTAAYMSPEQAKGEEVDGRTDLWALGALLYEMLAGEQPFQGSPQAAVIYSILHEEPVPLEERRGDTEANLEQVIGRCLKKDPSQRYESAEALLEDLHAVQEKDVPESDASPSYQTVGSSWSRISDLAMPRSVRRRPVGQQWLAGGAAALALLLFLLGWALWPEGSATESTSRATVPSFSQSIAVLPFETVGTGEASQFTEGIHGDVLTRLSNISGLKVISRTSVQQYRKTQKPTTEIGQELGAGWVLEGEVQETGGTVQVNARLINAQADQQAWARNYKRELSAENLFEIQEEITRNIANSLEAQLSPKEQKRIAGAPTEDLEAYRLYVQGRQELARRGFGYDEHVEQAVQYFHQAIERDSSYALAWAGLADAAAARIYEMPDSALASSINQEEAAQRALKLDPDLAEAHASMGYVHYLNKNAPAALREIKRALELKPSYWEAHQMLGWVYFILDRPSQALDHFQLAVELNPNHARARHGLYDAYNMTGQPEKALREARRQQQMGLEETGAVMGEVRALTGLGRFEEARQLAEEQTAELGVGNFSGGWFRVYLTEILTAQGDTASAKKYLGQLQNANVAPHMVASAYRNLGETGKALEAYEQLEGEDWYFVPVLGIRGLGEQHPSVRNDPRYQEVLRRAHRTWDLNPDGSIPEEN